MPEGFNLGTAYAAIQIDSSGIADGINQAKQSISGGLKDIGSSLTSLGSNLTVIGAPFLGLATVAQHAFDQMDDAADQLGAVLKSTGSAAGVTQQQALLLGAQLQDLTGITRANIVGGEAMLLTFTNIGKETFPRATKAAVDLSVAMKQDMKSSSIQLGKALNDPIKGITALTRVGVTFSQTQKDMIKTMVEAGNIAGAQGVILSEVEKEFGGSAAAAADPIDHLGATLNDLAIDIGVSLQPILEAVIPVITDVAHSIGQFFTQMSDNGDNTAGIILAIGAGLAILGPIVAIVGAGISALGGVFAALGSIIGLIFSPIGLVIAAIVGLYLAFQSNFLGIRDFLKPIFDSISNFFAHFSDNVKLYGSIIALYAAYYFQNVVIAIQKIIDKIDDFINANPAFVTAMLVIGGVVGVLVGIMVGVPLVVSLITGAVGLLTGALGILLSPAVLLIAAITGIIYAADKLYPGGIAKLFIDASTAAKELATIGMALLTNAVSWAHDRLIELEGTLKTIIDKIKEFLGLQGQISGQSQGSELSNFVAGGGLASQPGIGAPSSGIVAIPPVGGGSAATPSSQGFGAGGGGGLNIHGDVHVHANDAAGGKAAADAFSKELDDRYHGRGNN